MAYIWNRWRRRPASSELSPVVDPVGETPITISLLNYSEEEVIERSDINANECKGYIDKGPFTWIHIQGQPKPSELLELGKMLNLHPLALEDVIDTSEQRSKTEIYEDQVLVILGMPAKHGYKIIFDQVSFFLGDNFLVSFHSGEKDPFRAVRRRLNHPKAPMRTRKIDYLLYVLVDIAIDSGLPIASDFEKEIELVEQELLGPEGEKTANLLYTIKRELLILRLKMRPQREAVRVLIRDDNNMLEEETKIYLRDVYDHVIRFIDILEIYREMTSNMLDVHLSLVNNKTFRSNEVQRKASVWATLFAPLTFITGIYGMNFVFMPASKWSYGFLSIIGFMIILGVFMYYYFKRSKWL